MKTRAIVIDPNAITVTEVFLEGDLLEACYEAIGCELVECPLTLPNGDCLVVDEEGLLKKPEHFFAIQGFPQAIAGNAVVLGQKETEDGLTWTDCKSTVEEVKALLHMHGCNFGRGRTKQEDR